MNRNLGFSLLELLLVSALGSLLLLAASEVFARLVVYQNQQANWLRLEERAALATLALKSDLSLAQSLVDLHPATHNYPDFSERAFQLGPTHLATGNFDSAVSSDWLLINRSNNPQQPEFSLWHLDEKQYGRGLAHKPSRNSSPQQLSSSQTLIDGVELLRFRFYSDQQKAWLNSQQAQASQETFTGLQFALLLVSPQPGNRAQQTFYLWGDRLQAPDDGHQRLLITGTLPLRKTSP